MQAGKRRIVNRAALEKYDLFKDDPVETITQVASQGFCNLNYLVTTRQHRYLLRVFQQANIDRQAEIDIQKCAAKQGIAPSVLLEDEASAWVLMAWVPGSHRTTLNKRALATLAQTLQTLHTITCDAPTVDMTLQIRDQTPEVQEACRTLALYDQRLVLCHHDPNPKNMLWQDDHTLTLIDYEYAGYNDCYADIAAVCVEFALNQEHETFFCETYFEGTYHPQKLEAYKVLYRQLCNEWFEGNV